MKTLLNGKRIFQQESDETCYLVFNAQDIHHYYYFYEEVAIKKGDILYPQKWIKYSGSSLIKTEEFDFEGYEYIFILDKWTGNDLKIALQPYLEVNDDYTSIFTIHKLPDDAELVIKDVLGKSAYEKEQIMNVEAYAYPNEQNHFIILNSEVTDDDITYEHTKDFADKVILTTYQNKTGEQIEYLYKTAPQEHFDNGNIHFSSYERWFHSKTDPSGNFKVLKELHDLEDMLQFTTFQESFRRIPDKKQNEQKKDTNNAPGTKVGEVFYRSYRP
jgi:hypothetical protein